MEETDPARILPAKKQIAEATSSTPGGALPMVPPMGMPMSPHTPRVEEHRTPTVEEQLYTADMPAEGFGSPAVALHEPAVPADVGVPVAMTHSVAEPLIPAIPARQAGEVHILPVEDKPCTCCGDFHDGQETRPFDRHQDTHDRIDVTHDAHPDEPTARIQTDPKPDTCCCACCGDEHPGLDDVTGDGRPGGATGSDEDSEEEDQTEDKSSGDDEDPDDDCPADDHDDKPGDDKPGDDKPGDDKPGDDKRRDGDESSDRPGRGEDSDDGPGKDEDWDKCGNDSHDKPGKGDDKPGPDGPGRHPDDHPSGHEGGSHGKSLTPGTPRHERAGTPTDSNYAVDGGKPPTPANPAERATMAPPTLSKPGRPPTQTGVTTPGNQHGQGTPTTQTGGSLASRLTPPVQKVATPSASTPIVPPVTTGQNGNGGNDPGTTGPAVTGGEPKTFLKSVPPPGHQDNQGQGDGNGQGDGDRGGDGPGTTTQPQPQKTAMRPTSPSTVHNGTGTGNGSPSSTSGGPGGLFPPSSNGNVGPDPNVKFDEAAFNQLIAVVGGVRDTVGKATRDDVTYLDAELLVQPNNQTWDAAVKLVQRGGKFGGSVDTENTSLEKTLKTFHESLQLAKEVFKETDDLAAYDATRFTTAYPGFNSGGMPGGAF
ncbi:MAG: hypothetical protein M3422_22470 [Actinomycetota bacterium]|nr:hypothetical protein [Actinomycetota bacterium]